MHESMLNLAANLIHYIGNTIMEEYPILQKFEISTAQKYFIEVIYTTDEKYREDPILNEIIKKTFELFKFLGPKQNEQLTISFTYDNDISLLKKMIERVIIPQFPEVKKVLSINKGEGQITYVYRVLLVIDNDKRSNEIEKEIESLFKMMGLNVPKKDWKKSKVFVDFTF